VDYVRFEALTLIGGALLTARRYADAEAAIVDGYEGMNARSAQIPAPDRSRLRAVAERVVRLYEEWPKPRDAAAWKAKLQLRDLPTQVFATP
jgi:hypothetical protein